MTRLQRKKPTYIAPTKPHIPSSHLTSPHLVTSHITHTSASARRTRAPPQLATRPHILRARPHTLDIRPRARRAAPAPALADLLRITGRQAARARKQVEDIGEADDAGKASAHILAGELGRADADTRVDARVGWSGRHLSARPLPSGCGDVSGGGREMAVGVVRAEWRRRGAVHAWGGRHAGGGGGRVDDPHAVGAGGAELGDGVGEGGEGGDVEDGVGVAAVEHAALGEDDADEVDAGGGQEGDGGGVGEELDGVLACVGQIGRDVGLAYPDVHVADVAHDIPMAVQYRQ